MNDQLQQTVDKPTGAASALDDGLERTTLCWNCNTAYPMEAWQCPGCCATNANKDLASACCKYSTAAPKAVSICKVQGGKPSNK